MEGDPRVLEAHPRKGPSHALPSAVRRTSYSSAMSMQYLSFYLTSTAFGGSDEMVIQYNESNDSGGRRKLDPAGLLQQRVQAQAVAVAVAVARCTRTDIPILSQVLTDQAGSALGLINSRASATVGMSWQQVLASKEDFRRSSRDFPSPVLALVLYSALRIGVQSSHTSVDLSWVPLEPLSRVSLSRKTGSQQKRGAGSLYQASGALSAGHFWFTILPGLDIGTQLRLLVVVVASYLFIDHGYSLWNTDFMHVGEG
ncbi:hypothetical protein VTL71DRAFT_14426 [Oculimacula yallundae]|uniref:Uncharacterized protein n=1 Tax=Oculimacula yallundae TaxID=86028 RepID=A0ABR4CJ45_9HELO